MRKKSVRIGTILLLAMTTALSGCGMAVEEYSVIATTGEVSQVSTETFASVYQKMPYANDADVEGSLTKYGEDSDAAEGATSAAAEEKERKWRTILEDVSLFSGPEKGRVLMVIPKGSKVDVLTDKENQWYKIRYHGTTGFVKSGYFVEDWEAEKAERQKREEEEAKKKAEEEARKKAEAEKKRKEAEAKKKAEEEKKRKEEEAKKKAEEEAKKKAEEEARKKAEEERKRKEAAAKKREEEEAKKKAEEEAKKKAEEEKKKAAEEKKRKEAEAKKKAEEEKKRKAEEEKKRKEEEARRKAEEERARAMANGEVTRRLAETVNLRNPDDPEILYGIVPTGSYVTVLEDLGDGWFLVDYDGMEGMIKGGYFTEDDP